MSKPYRSFAEFYPFYLSQHQDRRCRRLHFIGSFLVLVLLGTALITTLGWLLMLIPLVGYGFAWIGHFVFERNQPATFQYPLYSLMADWVMFAQIFVGKIRF